MSANDNSIIVGAPGAGVHGAAYFFVRREGVWVEQATVVPPFFLAAQGFGRAVAIDAMGTCAVIAPSPPFLCHYELRDGELQIEATIDLPGKGSFEGGLALAADGERLIVSFDAQAFVYDYVAGGWHLFATLHELSGGASEGAALAADGQRAIVGNPWIAFSPSGGGAAYVIDLSSKSPALLGILTQPAMQFAELFGTPVALSGNGDTAVVVRPDDSSWLVTAGEAFVFQFNPGSGAGDADKDGASDLCDNCATLPNPNQADCDDDGIGDLCWIAGGAADCDADSIPDDCELTSDGALTYVLDHGMYDTSVGLAFGSYSLLWMNQFRVDGAADHIVAIDIAWGSVANGTLTTLCVWSDPTNDGDPTDAHFLRAVQALVQDAGLGTFVTVPIPPTYVGHEGDSFFVGAYVDPLQDMAKLLHYPAAIDESWPSQFRSWISIGMTPVDVSGPRGFSIKPIAFSYPGEWLIRARTAFAPDCDGDSVLDDCQIVSGRGDDLDGDGVLDACEDCDRDGIPDSLEIDRGEEQDCDRNHVPDSCDLAQGRSEGCNGDAVPDQCQVAKWFSIGSGLMSPIGVDSPQEFTMVAPPQPAGNVTVTVKAIGDFGFTSEYLTVRVNGVAVGMVFQETGEDCEWPLVESFIVPRAIWLVAVGAGDVVVTIDPSPGVDSSLCEQPSAALIAVAYLGAGSADADSDGVVDGCPGGADPADLNHDGAVDAFDLGILLSQWGSCAVPGVQCVADFNRDL